MALAFNQTGATPKKSSFNPFGDTSSGIIGSINKATGLAPTPPPAPISQGTNPGLLHAPAPKAQPKTHTVVTSPDGTTTTKQTFDTNTSNPVQTTIDNPKAPIQKSSPNDAPVGNTVGSQIQNVANTGNQTQNENNLQQGVLKAGQTTPDEKAFQDQYVKSVAGKQFGSLAPYAESSMYVGKTPEELQGLITAPDLVGRSSADTGLYNTLGSAYGNAALAGLGAAQTSAARTLQANTTAYGGAQTQAGRAATEANTVLGAVAPQYGVQYGTQVGQPGLLNGGVSTSDLGGIAAPANIRSIQDYTTQINTTQKSIDTLKGLGSTIAPNMGTTGFNPTSSPVGNDTFSTYFTEKNPAAKAGIEAGLGEIKNQISNVIASATGLTPTGVTAVTDTYDLTNLNPQQLNDFLLYIDKYAQINIDAANKNIDRIKNGGAPDANTGVLPTPEANSTGQAALGTGASAAAGLISKVLSESGNAVAGAAGGVASGLAKKVLGF